LPRSDESEASEAADDQRRHGHQARREQENVAGVELARLPPIERVTEQHIEGPGLEETVGSHRDEREREPERRDRPRRQKDSARRRSVRRERYTRRKRKAHGNARSLLGEQSEDRERERCREASQTRKARP
jgi:hypothetical protein